jgi:hypothetical protein
VAIAVVPVLLRVEQGIQALILAFQLGKMLLSPNPVHDGPGNHPDPHDGQG